MNEILNRQAFEPGEAADGRLSAAALDRLFREARTHNGWLEKAVPHALLEEAVELAKLGPTAVNASPFRVVFVETAEAKARLKPTLSPGNVDKTMAAPVTAIVGHDLTFYDHLPRLFPHADVRPMFADNETMANHIAVQNGTLQLAYFILALRALGLDTRTRWAASTRTRSTRSSSPGRRRARTCWSTSATATTASCSRAARASPSTRSPPTRNQSRAVRPSARRTDSIPALNASAISLSPPRYPHFPHVAVLAVSPAGDLQHHLLTAKDQPSSAGQVERPRLVLPRTAPVGRTKVRRNRVPPRRHLETVREAAAMRHRVSGKGGPGRALKSRTRVAG